MKKSISIALSLLLLLVTIPLGAVPVAALSNGEITYYYTGVTDKAVIISGYEDYFATDITIPETINGYPVIQIDPQAFSCMPMLRQLTLPEGLEIIGNYAFSDCYELTRVTIPDSVVGIGVHAFSGCLALTEVVLGDGLTEIPKRAFFECSNLTKVTVGNRVTVIQNDAFARCPKLTTLILPRSLKKVAYSAFFNSSCLTDVYYGGSESDWQTIEFVDGYGNLSPYRVTWHYNYTPEPTVFIGDANGDGRVNNRDLGLLQQHLNDWDVTIDVAACDVNGDGKINNRDLGTLQQLLNQ